ncbi:MAG: hypothetical protein C5B50_24555 [Verrucomicrobia bacterium]|nr:MAG: hypothetical protein C5B50_24555 [Verrucomicrobiota bacterium]
MTEREANALKPQSQSAASPATVQTSAPGRGYWWVWLVVVAVIVIGGLLVLRRPATTEQTGRGKGAGAATVHISTAVVRKGDVGIYLTALGTVTPVKTVLVKSRVDGELISVNYTEGQMVKAGDSLVEIDPRPYQALLIQAQGQLARDKAQLENAHVDLDRYQIALNSNAIPKQQFDTQVAAVHQFEGTVLNDEGMVSNAMVQVAYTHITAPISGRVGLRLVDAGNIVHATDPSPLAVIAQLQPMTMIFGVNEDDLPQIQGPLIKGEPLEVEAYDAHQTRKLATGRVVAMDSEIDTNTATIRLRAEFPNEDYTLFPNQPANARLLARTLHDALLVPTPAVQEGAQGAFVYVVQTNQTQTNQTVALKPVSLVITNPTYLLRTSGPHPVEGGITAVEGLQAGDIIATDSFNRLQDGAKVTIRSAEQQPGPGRHPGKNQNTNNADRIAQRSAKTGESETANERE